MRSSALVRGSLGRAATAAALASKNVSEYQRNEPDTVQYRQKANDQYALTNNLLYAAAGVWVIAILDAYWSGVDATSIDMEQLELSAAGLVGRF